MASSPEEYQQWRSSCTQQQQQLHLRDDNHDKWNRRPTANTPQTQNSTACNTSTSSEESDGSNTGPVMLDSVGNQQQEHQQHQQQESYYWTTPQVKPQGHCFRLDDVHLTSLEKTPHTSNHRPKQQIPLTTRTAIPFPTRFCSAVAAVDGVETMAIMSPSPSASPSPASVLLNAPRAVMRDATNTSTTEVESRALFPDSSDEDKSYSKPHRHRPGVDLKEQTTDGNSSTLASAVVKNGKSESSSSSGIMMKSRLKNSSPDHQQRHCHHHVLEDLVPANQPPLDAPSARLDQQHRHHHRNNAVVHPLLYHERNPSVDSSLSTLSSLDSDSTFDGSAQTSPHPYRQSSTGILVVSARKKIGVRRISTLATLMTTTDSHSLPPPRYNSKNNNNNHYDLKHHHHPTLSTTAYVDAAAAAAALDGTGQLPLSSSSRGGAHRATTAKSLLRLAATNNGLLWIMCFMALTSLSMTVLTSRIMNLEKTAATLYLENNKAGTATGSVLFPPTGFKQRVLVPVNPKHMQLQLRQASVIAIVDKVVEDKQDKTKQQLVLVNQKETTTSTKPRRHTSEEKTAATSNVMKNKHTRQKHKKKVDAKKATPTTIQEATFTLKPVQLPKGAIGEKRKETIDHKIYRTRQSSKGMAHQEQQNSRVIYMHESLVHQKPKPRKLAHYPADYTDSTQLYSVLDSGDERVRKSMEMREPYVQGECVPMQDWQTTFHPSCNHVHALSLDRMGRRNEDANSNNSDGGFELFGTKGFWRNAWKVQVKRNGGSKKNNTGSNEDVFVLKTLKIQHQFEDAHFEHSRIDAVAMERLTSSPHVINIFGFCGHSVMTEYADGNRLGALADKSRSTPLARLRIARDIATGLADVHGIDGDGNTTFVHLDVNPANIVSIGGTLKLNDFNIGIIRRWNTTSNEACGFPAQYPNPQWRSPEEARSELNLTEKVDVFSMGHIFFRLICGHEPWNKLEAGGKPSKTEMNEKVMQGILPTIPASVLQSTDKEVVAIREAMLQCYKFNPKERPTARNIANALQRALDKLERNQ